jgi:hypothetical protein
LETEHKELITPEILKKLIDNAQKTNNCAEIVKDEDTGELVWQGDKKAIAVIGYPYINSTKERDSMNMPIIIPHFPEGIADQLNLLNMGFYPEFHGFVVVSGEKYEQE